MPAPHIADQLIRPFFEIMHPAYPVFDRENFSRQYRQGQASPLVLQAMFLLGFTVCDDSLIEEAGFSDRATARRTHYLRAKALYDAEYESDHMNLVAVMLLLGFWWAGPEDQKDNCYWVNCAATMAQSLGMHRSYCHILLFRPKAIDNLTPAESERDKQARMAADAITRNAEDLLAAETIRSAQIHL
ncbi:hypothetical protein COL5a_008923 [Colletotrichum fioriniae]|nr:hypothetical protein COL5a_008923 [Colletotrichum fioriniae]